MSRSSITTKGERKVPIAHPGGLLRMELDARGLSASALALALGVPSGRITDILNERRSITPDTALRMGRYFGNGGAFWMRLQTTYDLAVAHRDRGKEIARTVRPAAA